MQTKPVDALDILDLLPRAPASPVSTCLFNLEDCFEWSKRHLALREIPVLFTAFPLAEMQVSRAMKILGFVYENGEYHILDRPQMRLMLKIARLDFEALDAILAKVTEGQRAKS
jgi:hypothetical protein